MKIIHYHQEISNYTKDKCFSYQGFLCILLTKGQLPKTMCRCMNLHWTTDVWQQNNKIYIEIEITLKSVTKWTKKNTLTSGMNLIKLNKKVLKSFVERPIIALQTTTCTKMSKQCQQSQWNKYWDLINLISFSCGTSAALLNCSKTRTSGWTWSRVWIIVLWWNRYKHRNTIQFMYSMLFLWFTLTFWTFGFSFLLLNCIVYCNCSYDKIGECHKFS